MITDEGATAITRVEKSENRVPSYQIILTQNQISGNAQRNLNSAINAAQTAAMHEALDSAFDDSE